MYIAHRRFTFAGKAHGRKSERARVRGEERQREYVELPHVLIIYVILRLLSRKANISSFFASEKIKSEKTK